MPICLALGMRIRYIKQFDLEVMGVLSTIAIIGLKTVGVQ